METHRKRYCRHCDERIRRATRHCPYCLKRTLPWKDYLIAGGGAMLLILLVIKYTGVI